MPEQILSLVEAEVLIVDGEPTLEILEVGTQGPPGPAGPVGPPGPPNTTPISTAPGNTLTLGPDNGLFVQQVWSGTPAW